MKLAKLLKCMSFANKEIGKPFDWNKNSCCMLFARLYDYLIDTNYVAICSKYNSPYKAKKAFLKNTMFNFLNKELKLIEYNELTIGDVIYTKIKDVECMGIYYGDKILSSDPGNGVHMIDVQENYELAYIPYNGSCFTKGVLN